MRDRTRRFTVGLGDASNHLRILAADEKTRAWADRHGPLMNIALWQLEKDLEGRPLARDPRPWEAVAPGGIETPRTIAARFDALLRKGFPEEVIEVRALPSVVS